jgi:hypothetical protein
VPVIRETATVAGSVTFYSNGVILGTAVAIAAHGDLTTELVTNGTFATDTDWTKFSATISSGVASVPAAALLAQAITVVVGGTYRIEAEIITSASRMYFQIGIVADGGSAVAASSYITTTGVKEFVFVAASSTTLWLRLRNDSGSSGTGEWDNVSVKRVATVNNAAARIINGTTTTRTAGSLQASRLFNRALTAAEVLDLSINGVALADRGASQTAVYTSDFSAAVDGWSASGVTLTANTDGEGGEDDWLKFEKSGSAGSVNLLKTSPVADGRRQKVSIKLRTGAGNTFTTLKVRGASGSGTEGAVISVPAGTTVVVERVMIAGTSLSIAVANPDNTTATTVPTTDDFFVKEIVVTRIGLTSELLASNAQSNTGQILDTSGNKNHALLPASGATVVGRPVSQTREVRWTNTWDGTNELQYIGGVNQAILPANAYIESIVGTVSGATPHDIIIGDGSDADRYVTITTGLAAGTTSFTLAARTTDGTNLKLTADPDTDATMSIAWVIRYSVLE